MANNHIHIHKSLLPVSWLYGIVVSVRNRLFDLGILKSRRFDLPVISIGNLAVGGTGKTPHVEYLIRLLKEDYGIAVLSRGYKRRTHGFVIATLTSTASDIGDEPMQVKSKFPSVTVAVDEDRCDGIEKLTSGQNARQVEVVLLDDAFQHRYVKPGLSILLIEYDRLEGDKMLPAGRLREPMSGIQRADVVVVTKCPETLTTDDMEAAGASLHLRSSQKLFFSTTEYQELEPLFCGDNLSLDSLSAESHVLLLTGIANPTPLLREIQRRTRQVTHLSFGDHHTFSSSDISAINTAYAALPPSAIVITTEKDAMRLSQQSGLSQEVRHHAYQLPIKVRFLHEAETFDQIIKDYVRETTKDRHPAQRADGRADEGKIHRTST